MRHAYSCLQKEYGEESAGVNLDVHGMTADRTNALLFLNQIQRAGAVENRPGI